jgi:hypothetical protein
MTKSAASWTTLSANVLDHHTTKGTNTMSNYNETAVNRAIKASRQPIGKKEAKLIHALLRGHDKPNNK